MPDAPDPSLYAIPLYLVAMLVEAPLLRWQRGRGADVLGYPERRDTAASLAMGIGSVPFVAAINAGVYALATLAWPHRVTDLGEGVLGWVVAILAWDFAYYWHHRIEHEVRLFWACHVNHHSSRYFNFSTALRQPWTPVLGVVLYPPIALLGVRPWMILFSGGVNLVFQFWVHTEAVGKLPWIVERVFNTPSHHRVHHGKNARYLDKNYGGIFILWDRLFHTFEEEGERVVYGLTTDIDTWNPLRIAFHEYAALGRDVLRSKSAREAATHVFAGPGGARAPKT
jgi:sterol desaturase/sphingolipid hydroxylase (fatty acid hydroxylase superfamily)